MLCEEWRTLLLTPLPLPLPLPLPGTDARTSTDPSPPTPVPLQGEVNGGLDVVPLLLPNATGVWAARDGGGGGGNFTPGCVAVWGKALRSED